jgi:hypothetical protein
VGDKVFVQDLRRMKEMFGLILHGFVERWIVCVTHGDRKARERPGIWLGNMVYISEQYPSLLPSCTSSPPHPLHQTLSISMLYTV